MKSEECLKDSRITHKVDQMDIYETLRNYADDSLLEITAYNREFLKICLTIDAETGEKYLLLIHSPLHLDMPPNIMLGSIEFGSRELLPEGYETYRNRGYEGDEEIWRVMKIMDCEENHFFAIYYQDDQESFEKMTDA